MTEDDIITWHPVKKLMFRFFFVYFFLYCFPFPFDSFDLTKPVAQPIYNLWDWLIPKIGKSWFHMHAKTAFPMFDKMDDSNYGLVFLYLNLIVSAIAAVIWGLIDKRKNYEKLYQWLRLYLRYYLAAFLFGYGFIKIFPSQFQAITAARLTMTVGDQSPMLLAWNFMGRSTVMMKVNGMAEVLAGLLLLFRRTTTIGAILSACVFSFVVMMDFCFNVPVRLLASHLLIISLFLALGDGRRLLNIFFLNKPTNTILYVPLVDHRGWRKALVSLQFVIAVSLLYTTISNAVQAEKQYGQSAPHVPLYGVYNTAWFIKNGDTLPALQTDSTRWKQLVIDGGSWKQSGIIQLNTDKKTNYNIHADTIKQTLTIQSLPDSNENYLLNYFKPDADHLLLKGLWKKDSIEVLMNRYDLNNYLLHREKFKWIGN